MGGGQCLTDKLTLSMAYAREAKKQSCEWFAETEV